MNLKQSSWKKLELLSPIISKDSTDIVAAMKQPQIKRYLKYTMVYNQGAKDLD